MLRRRPDIMKDGAVGFFGVDQKLRTCIQELWMTLPQDQASPETLKRHFQRLSQRALEDFTEDLNEFNQHLN